MKQFLKDGDELSIRRLVAIWAMTLLTALIVGVFFGVAIDTQIIVIVGGIATVATGASAIKNKLQVNNKGKVPFDK